MAADCKKCYWYKGGTCTHKYEYKNFDHQYNHPNHDCDGYE